MMGTIQALLIILLVAWMIIDQNGLVIVSYFPVIVGFITGLIMGDITTAMIIAGTFQLMQLGVANLGGSSMPNYGLATIIGAYLAIRTGTGIKTGIAVGLPVGMLAIQLDVLVKIINNFIAHRMAKLNAEHKWRAMLRQPWYGVAFFGLEGAIPAALLVFFGPSAVQAILTWLPKWFTNGLTIAGGLLPVIGVGMLLHYMPTKKFATFLIIGFVLTAYLNLPILAIALIGFACAYYYFNGTMRQANEKKASANSSLAADRQGDNYDE